MSLAEFRVGDLVSLWDNGKKSWSWVGYFVEADGQAFTIRERDGLEYEYQLSDERWTFYLVVAVIHRTPFERGGASEAERLKREAQIKMLQRRAARLTSNDEESERFHVLKQIYDLEHETDADEWPDEIAA